MLGFSMVEPDLISTDDDPAAFRAAVGQGLKSLDQGRSVSYETVRRWLLSWGSDRETPPPEYP